MAFSPVETDIILKFFMETLSEEQLSALDARLAGDDRATEAVAQDAALRDPKGTAWRGLDPRARHSVRQSRATRTDSYAADRRDAEKAFPHMNRL